MSILRCFSDSNSVTELKNDFDGAGVQVERSSLHFSTIHTEYVEIILPLATGVIGVLVAFIKRGKKFRVEYFENGQIKMVDSSNTSPEEIASVLEKLSEQRSDPAKTDL
ncbi:hypothetical protein M2407_000918 [Serratia sp. BIGb0234]|uniref:hypothetical protein n=1 Tax=Serratia sp. BIGb0234 TaxID=2940614 RepID=UPI0021688BF8|nr:hypothetical protein [Serratia sp. BIGb0234]MCS4316619.1 hypothetical protein [Serratia sp. BIGb0234]